MTKYFCIFLILIIPAFLISQEKLHIPVNIQECYENQTRSQNGKPGINHWQNKAIYDIDVQLEPDISKVSGNEKINYLNNSPDSLKQIVIALLSDILKKGNPNDFGIPLNALNEGVDILKVSINGKDSKMNPKMITRSGTNMFIKLQKPLLPGENIALEIDWSFVYPKLLTIRCGDYGDSTFFVAYFYPKIAVYDDIDGWDRHNYTGYGEYYGEFSDYNVNISVPGDFKVWATGELSNPDKVFASKYLKKWNEGQKSKKVYRFLNKENFRNKDITQNKDWISWNFKANNVPDFAFGTSDKFLWDMINVVVDKKTGRKSTLNAAYRIDSKDYYNVAELGKKVLTDYSQNIPGVPYPYPEMTIFNGNSGMEFPMMCNDVSCEPWHETAGLTYHEMAHTYFPFFVGTNERKYAWMDEGWANLFPYFYMHEQDPAFDYFQSRMQRYYVVAGTEIEVAIMTLGDLLDTRPAYRQASYNKSFFAYYYLYDYLGKERFKTALKYYINAWEGKHPMPYDFFNSYNTSTNENLNWYWNNWFFERNHADLAIVGIDNHELIIQNKGKLFLPVNLTITYQNGSKKIIEKDLSVWKNTDGIITIPLFNMNQIKSIELGDKMILDVNGSNNHWEK